MNIDDLKYQIESILHPEPDEDGQNYWAFPHKRLSSVHGLDISYFRGPLDIKGDGVFERLLNDDADPLHDTIQCITVPSSLLMASFHLFADSLIEYHDRERRWDLYRFYPSILMTVWSAFEAWLRISSEILVAAVTTLPRPVKEALLEVRQVVRKNGQIKDHTDRRSVLERYWLLLKYGCNLEFDRGNPVWQAANKVVTARDSLVHYNASNAVSLTASQVWEYIESVLMLFIAPSTLARRTLFIHQFDYYGILAELHSLISEFEERPLHKGWPRGAMIIHCPFDGIDETKYPPRWNCQHPGSGYAGDPDPVR